MEKPKVSLILVYKNASNTIKKCVDSVLEQLFQSFELICVNTGSTDGTDLIIEEYKEKDDRIKNIKIDENFAKKAAAMLTTGDYICFIDETKSYKDDFISVMYRQMTHEKDTKFKFKKDIFYNRNFIESFDKIEKVIENQIKEQSVQLKELIKKQKEFMALEFEKYRKEHIETISNKNYDLTVRFEQLEKNFYEKEVELKSCIDGLWERDVQRSAAIVDLDPVYAEMHSIKNQLMSDIDVKGAEIGRIYEDITANYKYTEELVNREKDYIYASMDEKHLNTHERLQRLEQYEELKFSNIKKLFDSQIDELDSKIKALENYNGGNTEVVKEAINVEKLINKNSENIYSLINTFNAKFYEDLSNMYKELNEKMMDSYKNQQMYIEKKINNLRNDFNADLELRISKLKNELGK